MRGGRRGKTCCCDSSPVLSAVGAHLSSGRHARGQQTKGVRMPRLSDLTVKLFTDGADKAQILDMARQPWINGFTTNPSLLKKAGVRDYVAYGRDLVVAV